MAIAVDAVTDQYNGAASSDNITWEHTVGAGSDRILVVTYPESRDVTIDSITYDGNALTYAKHADNGDRAGYIYYLKDPDVGAANVVITIAVSTTYLQAGAVSLTGVDQATPIGATDATTGTAQNKSHEFTTDNDNSYIIEALGTSTGVHTPTAGQSFVVGDSAGQNRVGSYDAAAAAGGYTQTWSTTASGDYGWAFAEVNEAAAGTSLQDILGTGIIPFER